MRRVVAVGCLDVFQGFVGKRGNFFFFPFSSVSEIMAFCEDLKQFGE